MPAGGRADGPLYYSYEVGPAHVIVLASFFVYSSGSAQYNWLQADLAKVDRTKTPWLLVIIHAPWYNSNSAHQCVFDAFALLGRPSLAPARPPTRSPSSLPARGDGELMRQTLEPMLHAAKVNMVFAGEARTQRALAHPPSQLPKRRAAERNILPLLFCAQATSTRTSVLSPSTTRRLTRLGPSTSPLATAATARACVSEGNGDALRVARRISTTLCHLHSALARPPRPPLSTDTKWVSPQPSTSAFRQSEYGHGELTITSATTATWTWIRNADLEPKQTDSVTITNIAA